MLAMSPSTNNLPSLTELETSMEAEIEAPPLGPEPKQSLYFSALLLHSLL